MSSGYLNVGQSVNVAKATFTYQQLNAATTGVTLQSGIAIPANSLVISCGLYSSTQLHGNGDQQSQIRFGIGAQTESILADSLIDDVPQGAYDESSYSAYTTSGFINATWTIGGTDTALDAGNVNVYVIWIPL